MNQTSSTQKNSNSYRTKKWKTYPKNQRWLKVIKKFREA